MRDVAMTLWTLLAAVVVLTACVSRDAETPAQRLYAVQGEFNIVQQAVLSYVRLPDCAASPVGACSRRPVRERLVTLTRESLGAIRAARTALAAGSAVPEIAAASAALRSLTFYVAEEEIGR